MDTGTIIEVRRVDRPDISWAQFLFELDNKVPDAGATRVPVNLVTLLGGFARFRGTEAQQKAAARFKSLYERSQLGGSKAIDPSIEAVDGGKANPEAIFEIGADARRDFLRAQQVLGGAHTLAYRMVEFVLIHDRGPTPFAKHFFRLAKPNNVAVSRALAQVRDLMDVLAVHFGFQSK